MDLNTVFTKTSKGAMEVAGKSRDLSREQSRILTLVDGRSAIGEILDKAGRMSQGKLEQILGFLSSNGYIRMLRGSGQTHLADELGFSSTIIVDEANTQMFVEAQVAHERRARKRSENEKAGKEQERDALLAELKAETDAARQKADKEREQAEAAAKAKAESEQQARLAADKAAAEEVRRKAEAERKAKEDAERKAEAERKARLEAEIQAKTDAERRAREEAERKAVAESKARAEAEARAREQAEAKARLEAEAKEIARKETEAKARAAAEAQARAEAEARMREAEAARRKVEEEKQVLARQLEEARLAAELESRAKRRLEARAREEEETRQRKEAEARAKLEEEARRRAEAEEKARAESEARQRAEEAAKAQAEAERRARQEAEARAAAEAQARAEAEQRAREEAQARAKAEQEAKARAEAEQRARAEAEARAKAEQEAKARAEAEQRARQEAEAKARAKAEAETRAREEAEARAKAEQEAKARAEAEQRARQEAEAKARAKAEKEAQARAEAEQRARQEAEAKDRAEEEARRRAEEDKAAAKEEAERRARDEEAARQRAEVEAKARMDEEAQRVEAEIKAATERVEREEAEAKEQAERRTRELAEERARAEAAAAAREEERLQAKATAESHARMEAEEARRRAEEQARFLMEEEAREREEAEARAQALAQAMSDEQAAFERGLGVGRPKVKLDVGKWLRYGAIGGFALLLLAFLLAHVISFNFYAPQLEGQLAQALGERVKIGALSFSAFPAPHWKMEQISLGGLDDIKISKAEFQPAWDDWGRDVKLIKLVRLEGVAIDSDSLAKLPSWFARQATAALKFERIEIKHIKLSGAGIEVPGFDARVDMRSGALRQATLTTVDQRATVEIEPMAGALRVRLHAQKWVPPIGINLQFDELDIQGVARAQVLEMSSIFGTLHGGSLKGSGRIAWGDGWSAAADVELKRINLATAIGPFTGEINVEGALDAKANISTESPDLAGLLAVPQVRATFLVRDGLLGNIDLVRAINAPAKSIVSGGETRFNDFSGYLQLAKAVYQYRQLRLSLGMLSASGAVEIRPDKTISGTVASELKSKTTAIKVPLTVSGTLATPVLRGGAGPAKPKPVEAPPAES